MRSTEQTIEELVVENERLKQDCSEFHQIISTLEQSCDPYRLKAAGIGVSDIIRVLDNALAASEGRPRPHNDLLPWPKEKTHDNGHYVHKGNTTGKKSYWLPAGVTVGYKHSDVRRTQLYFKVNFVIGGDSTAKTFYAGTLDRITETDALHAQDAAIKFRFEFEEACLRNTHFAKEKWNEGKWRNMEIPRTAIKPPRPYTSVDTLEELIESD